MELTTMTVAEAQALLDRARDGGVVPERTLAEVYRTLRPVWRAQREARRVEHAQEQERIRQASLDRWRPVWAQAPVSPSPALADLRDAILARTEKRCPKWRFRLAPDLVFQLQPRPALVLPPSLVARGHQQPVLRFEGLAVEVPDATAAHLTDKPTHGQWITFTVVAHTEPSDVWLLKLTRIGRRAGHRDAGPEDFVRLRQRVAEAFSSGTFDRMTPDLMLGSHCLICGKALTDPASMARYIGPECFGSGTLTVRGLLDAHARDDAAVALR